MKIIINPVVAVFALFSTLFITAAPAQAARVSPMIVELEPTGRASVARIDVINDGEKDIPYEVQMMRGEITPDGKLNLTPADEEFVVFPAQTLIEANSQQVFRVQYIGESAENRSQVYYMAVRQIPVSFDPGVSEIQVVVNFNVLVNVVPDGTEPQAVVNAARVATRDAPDSSQPAGEDGEPVLVSRRGIEVDAGNVGNRFYLAGFSEWKISGESTDGEPFTLDYSGDEASRSIGVGVVAPDANRIFFFPTEMDVAPGSLKVEISN